MDIPNSFFPMLESKLDNMDNSINCIAGALSDKHTTVAAGLHELASANTYIADALYAIAKEIRLTREQYGKV